MTYATTNLMCEQLKIDTNKVHNNLLQIIEGIWIHKVRH